MAMKTVNDIYTVAVENSTPMLSTYSSAFWESYVSNYTYYDRLFRRSYLSFKYFLQLPDATAEEVLDEFTSEVYAHLLINDKKYTELYRLNNLSDTSYDFTKPYNMTESYSGQYENDGVDNLGSSVNTNTNVVGAREDSDTIVNGAREDSNTNVYGSRQDSDTLTTGSQTTTNTNKVSPYDTDEFYNESENTDAVGGRTDTTSTNVGEQTNTESKTIGSQTNTETRNIGEQTNTQTQNLGAKENTNHKEGNDSHTITRYGYDSRHLPTESLEAHEKFWSLYEFYAYIFSEICAELLIV